MLETWKQLPRYWATALRGTLIGCWMGVTPGGATPASFMSYGIAKRVSRNGSQFGKGHIEGVVAPETAAHAAGTSALLPMLTLGIPGSPTAAVLLGGLLIWGLQPGPLLFVEQKDFVWGLIASIHLGDMAEASFRQAMLLSQGSVTIFWSNGLVGTIMALGVIMLFWQPVSALLRRRR